MLSSTKVIINSNKYRAEIGRTARSGNGLNIGYNIDLYKGSQFVGSVDVLISSTLRISWAKRWENSEENSNWLKNLLVITLPYINIECDEEQIKKDGLFSFILVFVSDRNQIDGNTIYIQGEWESQRQVEKLVYNDEIDDEKVEFNALEYLEECFKQETQPILVSDLIKALYIDPKISERAIGNLYNNSYVIINEYKGTIVNGKIIITTKGTNHLREMKKQDTQPPSHTYNIAGDFVQGSKTVNTTYGQGSHIIQNSHDVQVINENIDKLLQQLETDYKESDKAGVVGKVEQVKEMVKKGSQVVEIVDKVVELLPKIKKYAAAALILLKLLAHLYVTPVS